MWEIGQKAVGGGEDREMVLFHSKENKKHEKHREDQERGDNNILIQIWPHWIKQYTVHYRATSNREM